MTSKASEIRLRRQPLSIDGILTSMHRVLESWRSAAKALACKYLANHSPEWSKKNNLFYLQPVLLAKRLLGRPKFICVPTTSRRLRRLDSQAEGKLPRFCVPANLAPWSLFPLLLRSGEHCTVHAEFVCGKMGTPCLMGFGPYLSSTTTDQSSAFPIHLTQPIPSRQMSYRRTNSSREFSQDKFVK